MSTLQSYKYALGGPPGSHGYAVVEDLKRAHFFYGPTASPPIDPLALAYNEGQRNVILRIMAILESKEEDYGDNRIDGLSSNRNANLDRTDINAAADAIYSGAGASTNVIK